MPKVRTSDWQVATNSLHRLIPDCHDMTPDAIADAARLQGCEVRFERLEGSWELLSDFEILRKILPDEISATNEVLTITEASFTKAAPFVFTLGQLEEFIDYHRATCGESAVNGDLVLLLPSISMVILLHHEGYFARISCAVQSK